MDSSLRKDLFKEAARTQIEKTGVLGGGVLVGAAVLLTAATTPWLAPLWLAGAGLVGLGLSVSGARTLLRNNAAVPEVARRTVLAQHAPREVPPELLPYVTQSVESAIEIITRVEQARGQPVYEVLSDVVDTVGFLLDKICSMCERIVNTERLFDSLQQQAERLPGGRLPEASARDFERNLAYLQRSIDAAREQIVDSSASLQQIAVQTLMIQAHDAALVDDTTGSLRRLASDQAELLQARIAAMEEVARTTQAASGRLLGP